MTALDRTKLATWVREDTVPDWARGTTLGINVWYIDPRSGNASSIVKSTPPGKVTGCYFATSWQDLSPTDFAHWVSDTLNKVAPRIGPAEAPPCMLDLEAVTSDWQAAMITEYRKRQPNRPTSYTNAPGQNQTVVPVDVLAAANMDWYVQLYYGDMTPVEDPAGVMMEVARIYDPARVRPFYDGERLPAKRPYDVTDGCVFVWERIPA